jgi:Proteins of 100 residues with WXG
MSVAAPEHGVTIPAGDPQVLRTAAGRLSAAAAAMDGVDADLGASAEAACGGRRWVGPASVAFHRHVQETREAVRTGSRAFHDAAAALTRLAGELQAAQEEARRAQAAALAASSVIGSATRDLTALAATAEPDPLAQSRLQRTLDDANAELTGARAVIAHATERASAAGRSAAAALQAVTAAATVPRSPERAGACETTAQWLGRQAGDVFWDSLNPLSPEHDTYQRARIYSDWSTGLLVGTPREFHKYAAKHWVTYEPGYWAREPRLVRGHWRGTPSGGRTWVNPYVYPGRWVDAREVPDLAKRVTSSRYAKLAGRAGGVLAFGTAALDQWVQDRDRPDLSAGERTRRIATASGLVGGSALAGAAAGAAIGSAVPGVGTVVGAAIGGVIGSGVGQAVGNKIKGWLF